jgi:hypothetical protein
MNSNTSTRQEFVEGSVGVDSAIMFPMGEGRMSVSLQPRSSSNDLSTKASSSASSGLEVDSSSSVLQPSISSISLARSLSNDSGPFRSNSNLDLQRKSSYNLSHVSDESSRRPSAYLSQVAEDLDLPVDPSLTMKIRDMAATNIAIELHNLRRRSFQTSASSGLNASESPLVSAHPAEAIPAASSAPPPARIFVGPERTLLDTLPLVNFRRSPWFTLIILFCVSIPFWIVPANRLLSSTQGTIPVYLTIAWYLIVSWPMGRIAAMFRAPPAFGFVVCFALLCVCVVLCS